MPHLAFFATLDDLIPVIHFVLGACQVFESFSTPDSPLQQFTSTLEVRHALDKRGVAHLGLMLYAPSMNGQFSIERFELRPGAIPGKSWREQISGWGMIQIELFNVQAGKLRPSFTNHNSENRARRWANTAPYLPSVDAWDFREVARISRRINRYISGLAVRKDGSRPILPSANAMVARGDIILETN